MLQRLNLTLLEPQSRFVDKPVKFQIVCPQNGTAVLKGLKPLASNPLSTAVPFGGQTSQLLNNVSLKRDFSLKRDEEAFWCGATRSQRGVHELTTHIVSGFLPLLSGKLRRPHIDHQ